MGDRLIGPENRALAPEARPEASAPLSPTVVLHANLMHSMSKPGLQGEQVL